MRKADKMRQALMRSNTRLLLTTVVVFQLLALALLALRPDNASFQPLILLGAVPLATLITANLMGKLWPVDRAILILTLLLCSIGVITLSAICRSEQTPREHAIYALLGIAAMFVGVVSIRAFSSWKRAVPLLMILCALALLTPWAPKPFGGWR